MSKKQENNLNSALPVIFGVAALIVVIITSVVMISGGYYHRYEPEGPTPVPSPDPEPTQPPTPGKNFINLSKPSDDNELPEDGALINDFETLSSIFNDESEDDYDFTSYSYIFFHYTYDDCIEADIAPTSYRFNRSENSYIITLSYNETCGFCAPIDDYWLLQVPKTQDQYPLSFNYVRLSHENNCGDDMTIKKPIIYLYPTTTTDVSVKLAHPELITSSYPKYINGWQVTADPSGKLIDKQTGRELYSLYWEGANRNAKMYADGFVVKGSDTATFLEDKLATLGLTEREAEEFIIYWLPVLEQNNYNYIRFETLAEINSYMPLEINPKPDTLIRVIMDYKPLDAPINVTEQKLTTPTRSGFTVVEWGGTQIK